MSNHYGLFRMHPGVLWALRLDPTRLPSPRADSDREALRVLLCAREELTTTGTGQINRLKALQRDGYDRDRALARGRFTDTDLNSLARRRLPREANRDQAVLHAEVRRLTVALPESRRELRATTGLQLQAIVHGLAPGLTECRGIGRSVPPRSSCRSRLPGAAAMRPRSPPSAG
jgi:transposase